VVAVDFVAEMRRKRKPSEDKFRFDEWFFFRKIRQLERSIGRQRRIRW
jgi:hypothetical protein